MASSLSNLGVVASALGEYETAREYFQQGLAISQAIGDQRTAALFLYHLGRIDYYGSAFETARDYFQQSLVISQAFDDQWESTSVFSALGIVAYRQEIQTARKILSAKVWKSARLLALNKQACFELQISCQGW
ncbi:MAG: tetratricopeptide repeat protein [Chloroflexota bacterium]